VIRHVEVFIGGISPCQLTNKTTASAVKVKYEFCHGFMQDVIRSQMLTSQLDKLYLRISDFREQQQKEFRHKFFEKAQGTLTTRFQNPVVSSSSVGSIRRILTMQPSFSMSDLTSTLGADSSSESSIAESSTSEKKSPILRSLANYLRLKVGMVYVKKSSSVFSALKLTSIKGLRNSPMWKKRWAVLQNTRLLLQYDQANGSQPRRCTSLYLEGARVAICDANMAPGMHLNCFQVEVQKWTRGKKLMTTPRFFIIGVDRDMEVDNWIYMLKYAIESIALPAPEQ